MAKYSTLEELEKHLGLRPPEFDQENINSYLPLEKFENEVYRTVLEKTQRPLTKKMFDLQQNIWDKVKHREELTDEYLAQKLQDKITKAELSERELNEITNELLSDLNLGDILNKEASRENLPMVQSEKF